MARHHAAVVDPSGRRVLLRCGRAGWSLPRFAAPAPVYGDTAQLCRAASQQLGLDVHLLRDLGDAGQPAGSGVFVFESPAAHLGRRNRRWAGPAQLEALPFAEAWQRDVLRQLLREEGGGRGAAGEAWDWSHPGWLTDTEAWLRGELRRLGEGEVRSIEQLRVWEFSCLLRIHGTRGSWYLKAVPPEFAREPVIMAWLSGLRPLDVPPVVAHDSVHRRYIMPECRGTKLAEIGDLAAWEATLERYARLQIACINRVGELAELGCPQRSLSGLARYVDTLLADEAALLVGEQGGLTSAEVASLRARAPALKAACRELERSGIPISIEHGDLWDANVIVGDTGPVFLDWTDASLTHPFLSLLPLFTSDGPDRQLAHVPDVRTRLRDAYLDPWRELLPGADLASIFELAETAAALHHAANYHGSILLISTGHGAGELLPFFLKTLFAHA
jgi:hypothetical protein